ncbi:hypothetical protein M595_2041 [Lyngbya aestuarii BL J]|uniref:Uncharacterized protein n=1 Tax=Lyngbya aestuarii BL J TaxID=1348334 RepID=U7QKX0_9CYAN|nr:hypothetical protein M595_2041 [Lyngbya aestuarii BL J]
MTRLNILSELLGFSSFNPTYCLKTNLFVGWCRVYETQHSQRIVGFQFVQLNKSLCVV